MLRLGLDPEGLGELVAVTELFNGLNRVADAYQVEPDVKPDVGGRGDQRPKGEWKSGRVEEWKDPGRTRT